MAELSRSRRTTSVASAMVASVSNGNVPLGESLS